jgi:hypothetical protein
LKKEENRKSLKRWNNVFLGPAHLNQFLFTYEYINPYQTLCNGGQHYVPYRWLLISNKMCDSTLYTCGGVGGEEQVHNVDYDPVQTVEGGGEQREQRKSKRERGDVYTTRVQMALTLAA